MVTPAYFFFLLLFCAAEFHFPVGAELAAIRIDCGLSGASSSITSTNEANLKCVPDDDFIQSGVNMQIDGAHMNTTPLLYQTLRSFPNYTRNCYSLPAIPSKKYILRASFMYGNYDGLNKLPSFDLYLGLDLWDSIQLQNTTHKLWTEIVVEATSKLLYVCLVHRGSGTPFVSGLEQQTLDADLYTPANSSLNVALKTFLRVDVGSSSSIIRSILMWGCGSRGHIAVVDLLRSTVPDVFSRMTIVYEDLNLIMETKFEPLIKSKYALRSHILFPVVFDFFGRIVRRHPSDRYDRIWTPSYDSIKGTLITSDQTVADNGVPSFYEPSEVLQTAVYSPIINLSLAGTLDDQFHVFFYFADLLKPANTSASRQLRIQFNGGDLSVTADAPYLSGSSYYSTVPYNAARYVFTILPDNSSDTLDAVLNAFEVYKVLQLVSGAATLSQDVDAINSIRDRYQVKKNWVGDPCLPQGASWDGLICKSDSYGSQTIVALDLSSSGLNGTISDYFSRLKNLKTLNLSNNSLSGCIPSSLKIRVDSGLKLSIDNTVTCPSPLDPSGGKDDIYRQRIKVALSILASLLCILALTVVAILRMLKGRRQGEQNRCSFTYQDITEITNNFESIIGRGGSADVYYGRLKDRKVMDGLEVAVKVLGGSHSQGFKEFAAEVQLLLQVHHKHLISFIGFCNEGNRMILVYEYMRRGNLRKLLSDQTGSCNVLNWMQRLHIARDAALGIDYLHTGCRTPIIHRDVKTTNILINENLEAKIADFGLSKIGHTNDISHITTAAAGTPGYMDPEYYNTNQLTEKSDVYSFGVVLFELITGQCPFFILGSQRMHLLQWVTPLIIRGDIARMVDPVLHGQYDINSVQKVVDIAMACTAEKGIARPTMMQVVNGLRHAVEMEGRRARAGSSSFRKFMTSSSSSGSHLDYKEMSFMSVR